MARGNRLIFEFKAGPLAESQLVVTRLEGEESLSEPFTFEVELFPASLAPLDVSELLGTAWLLTVRHP